MSILKKKKKTVCVNLKRVFRSFQRRF